MANISSIFADLLRDPAAQQFALAAGKDISAGRPIGQEVGRVGEQLLGAKSQAKLNERTIKMLQQMLGKGVDFKSDAEGKVTVSTSELSGMSSLLSGEDTTPSMEMAPAATNVPAQDTDFDKMTILNSILNPPASPLDDISISDLAGLTSKDVSQALSGAIGVETLRQKRISAVAGMPLAQAKTRLVQAQTTKALKPEDKRTSLIKNYEFAQSQGFPGTISEWKTTETTHKRDFDEAVKGGYTGDFHTWMLEMAKAGAINLGDVAPKAEQTLLGKDKARVQAGDYVSKTRELLSRDKRKWRQNISAAAEEFISLGHSQAEAREFAEKKLLIEEIDRDVRATYIDKLVERRRDGWYVDGELKVRMP